MSLHEPFAQVAHQNEANEQLGHLFEQIDHLLIFANFFVKNKRFAQKTDEQIPKAE